MFDVITFGSATRDGFFEGIDFVEIEDKRFFVGKGICLPYGSKLNVKKVTFLTGGGALNTAVTFSRFGFKTAVVCRIGQDVSGEEILRQLKREKIYTRFVQIDKNLRTAYSVIFLFKEGERTILNYRGAGDIKLEDINWRQLKSRWFFVGPLGGNFDLLQKIYEFAAKRKIKLASTPGNKELEILKEQPEFLNHYDVFILNQEEAAHLTGLPYEEEKKIFQKLDKLVDGIVVMTKGPEGLSASDGQKIYSAGVFKEQKVVDRTGAGDAFASGFLAGLMLKNDLTFALRIGSANATSVVEQIGAQPGILRKEEIGAERFKNLEIKVESI